VAKPFYTTFAELSSPHTLFIKGIDINPRSIATCEARLRRAGDRRIAFVIGNSTAQEDTGAYDAIFCMAVLRRSELAAPGVNRCDHLIRFADFERQVTDFARCLKDGGFCVIRHTKFRFADTHVAAGFEPVLQVVRKPPDKTTPLFDRNNCRLMDAVYSDVVFRKCLGSYG